MSNNENDNSSQNNQSELAILEATSFASTEEGSETHCLGGIFGACGPTSALESECVEDGTRNMDVDMKDPLPDGYPESFLQEVGYEKTRSSRSKKGLLGIGSFRQNDDDTADTETVASYTTSRRLIMDATKLGTQIPTPLEEDDLNSILENKSQVVEDFPYFVRKRQREEELYGKQGRRNCFPCLCCLGLCSFSRCCTKKEKEPKEPKPRKEFDRIKAAVIGLFILSVLLLITFLMLLFWDHLFPSTNAASTFSVNGIERDCVWLRGQDIDTIPVLCKEAAEAACPETCKKSNTEDDTDTDTGTMITSPPRQKHCDDTNGTFWVPANQKREPCIWLQARPELITTICSDPTSMAKFACPETCGKCTDECEDSTDDEVVLVDGIGRSCEWLRIREDFIVKLCDDPESDAAKACPETCDICDYAPTDTPLVTTQVQSGVGGSSFQVDTTAYPAAKPTPFPTKYPTTPPTLEATAEATIQESGQPTKEPTHEPTIQPTVEPAPPPTPPPTPSPTDRSETTACSICSNNPNPYMESQNEECSVEYHLVQIRCKYNSLWRKEKYCQESCYFANLGYDGDVCCATTTPPTTIAPAPQPPTPLPTYEHCTNCSDVPNQYLIDNNVECSNDVWWVKDNLINRKCNRNAEWRNNKFCRASCYRAGWGYEGDVCC